MIYTSSEFTRKIISLNKLRENELFMSEVLNMLLKYNIPPHKVSADGIDPAELIENLGNLYPMGTSYLLK